MTVRIAKKKTEIIINILIATLLLFLLLVRDVSSIKYFLDSLFFRIGITELNIYMDAMTAPEEIRGGIFFSINRVYILFLYIFYFRVFIELVSKRDIHFRRFWNSLKHSNHLNVIFIVLIIFSKIILLLVFLDRYSFLNLWTDINHPEFVVTTIIAFILLLKKIFKNKIAAPNAVNKKSYLLDEKEINSIPLNSVLYRSVNQLKWLLMEYEEDDRYVSIALNGQWGSGKTSVIESFIKTLEKDNIVKSYEILKINLWELNKPEDIYAEIQFQLGSIIKKNFYMVPREFFTYFKILLDSFKLNVFHSLIDSFNVGQKSLIEIDRILNDALNTSSKKKLIIIFDDIDRIIDKKEIVFFMKIIRYLTQFKNCIAIMALDYNRIEDILCEENADRITINHEKEFNSFHHEKNNSTGNLMTEYINKIFSLKVDLPASISKDELAHYLRTLFDKKETSESNFSRFLKKNDFNNMNNPNPIGKDIRDFIESENIHGLFKTYRDIKLTVNDFLLKLEQLIGVGNDKNKDFRHIISEKTIFLLSYLRIVKNELYLLVINSVATYNNERDNIINDGDSTDYPFDFKKKLLAFYKSGNKEKQKELKGLFEKFDILFLYFEEKNTATNFYSDEDGYDINFPVFSIDDLSSISFYLNLSFFQFDSIDDYSGNAEEYDLKCLLGKLKNDSIPQKLNDSFLYTNYIIDFFGKVTSYYDDSHHDISISEIFISIFEFLSEIKIEKDIQLSHDNMRKLCKIIFSNRKQWNKVLIYDVLISIIKYIDYNPELLPLIPQQLRSFSLSDFHAFNRLMEDEKIWENSSSLEAYSFLYLYSAIWCNVRLYSDSSFPISEYDDFIQNLTGKLSEIGSKFNKFDQIPYFEKEEIFRYISNLTEKFGQKSFSLENIIHFAISLSPLFSSNVLASIEKDGGKHINNVFRYYCRLYLHVADFDFKAVIDEKNRKYYIDTLGSIILLLDELSGDLNYKVPNDENKIDTKYCDYFVEVDTDTDVGTYFDIIRFIREQKQLSLESKNGKK